jgi:hypothetical protein
MWSTSRCTCLGLILLAASAGCGAASPDEAASPQPAVDRASAPVAGGQPIVNDDWGLAAVKLPDPCTVLSLADLNATLGRTDLGTGRLESAPNGGQSCTFPAKAGGGASISIGVQSAESFTAVRAMLEREPSKPHGVPSLGDDAYFWDDRLYIRVGQRSLTVWVAVAGEPSRVSALALAKAVIARLR